MRLILDCDGVLLNYADGFAKYFCQKHGREIPKGDPDSFDMSNWIGRPAQEILSEIAHFNSGRVMGFGRLEPMPGAVEAVAELHRHGWDMRIATSMSDAGEAEALRHANLNIVFGPVFSEMVCLPLGACKKNALARLAPGIFIDDLAVNVRAGIEAGHHGLLMSLAHNRDETGIDRIKGWPEILEFCLRRQDRGLSAPTELS